MSLFNEFGLQGVSSTLQFGKGGNKLVSSASVVTLTDATSAPVRVNVANAVNSGDALTMGQFQTLVGNTNANASAVFLGALT